MRKLKKILGITALVTTLSLSGCAGQKNEEPTTEEIINDSFKNDISFYEDYKEYKAKDLQLVDFIDSKNNERKYYIMAIKYDYSYQKKSDDARDDISSFIKILEYNMEDAKPSYIDLFNKCAVTKNEYRLEDITYDEIHLDYDYKNITYDEDNYHVYYNSVGIQFKTQDMIYSSNTTNVFDSDGKRYQTYADSKYHEVGSVAEKDRDFSILFYNFEDVFQCESEDVYTLSELLDLEENCNFGNFKPAVYINK